MWSLCLLFPNSSPVVKVHVQGSEGQEPDETQRWSVAELNKKQVPFFVFSPWTMRAHSRLAWDADAVGRGLGLMETITPNEIKPSLVFLAMLTSITAAKTMVILLPSLLSSHLIGTSIHSHLTSQRKRGSLLGCTEES